MKRQSAKVQQLKGKIASLINLVKLGIKKYIVRLLDLEAELAIALSQQIQIKIMKYSEEKIKEAFVSIKGDLNRDWKPEMIEKINKCVGQGIKPNSPWNYKEQFPVVKEMVQLKWQDWKIHLCLLTAEYLENNDSY